ncbi:MAG: hypothetical protein ACKVT2_17470 [Saprospiraceae bacterium]
MKNQKKPSNLFIVSIVVVALIIIGGCVGIAKLTLPSDPAASCTVSATEFDSWFESGAVSLNGVVKPANSVTFSDIPNCDFYKWSEQMFLWLTSPAPARYGGGGRIFNSPAFYDVSPLVNGQRTFIPHNLGAFPFLPTPQLRTAPLGTNKLPLVIEAKTNRAFEIEPTRFGPNKKQLVQNIEGQHVEVEKITLGGDRKPIFFDSEAKPIKGARPIFRRELRGNLLAQRFVSNELIVVLDATGRIIDVSPGQADHAALMSKQGSLIYFQVTVNDVFAYFKTGVVNGNISATQFPTSQGELDDIVNYATSKGKTLIDPEALAIEIKTSWVEASTLPATELDRFITLNATIPTYDKLDPNEWIPNGQKVAKLALIGMHVVGSTNGHPEMIWATFEHESTAPNAIYDYKNISNVTVTVPQSTAGGNWILCANGSTGPFNDQHMSVNSSNGHIQRISPFTIDASNTLRNQAWGADRTQRPNPLVSSTAQSNSDIISINNSVRSKLLNGDVRSHYIQTGSTWTIGGASPNGPFTGIASPGKEVGTSLLANPSLETYVQAINCFACHGTNTVAVSNVWGDLQPLFTP